MVSFACFTQSNICLGCRYKLCTFFPKLCEFLKDSWRAIFKLKERILLVKREKKLGSSRPLFSNAIEFPLEIRASEWPRLSVQKGKLQLQDGCSSLPVRWQWQSRILFVASDRNWCSLFAYQDGRWSM